MPALLSSQLTFEPQLTADEVKALSKQPKKTAEFSLEEELRVRIERPTVLAFLLLHTRGSCSVLLSSYKQRRPLLPLDIIALVEITGEKPAE